MNRILFILIGFWLFAPNQAEGQTLKAFLKAAVEATEEKDFYNAMYYYSQAVEFDTTNLDNVYMYAESAMTFNAYSISETQFQYVADNDEQNNYPLTTFHLAEMQQRQGKYEDAKRNYELFVSENNGEQPLYINRAEKEIAAIDWAISNIDNPIEGVEIEQLGGSVNTPYSDFGAIEKDDNLYYSSLRFESDDQYSPNRLYSKILTDGNDSSQQEDISHSDEKNLIINHEAHTAFSHDGTKMYYTLCEYINSTDIRCDLYVKSISENNEFGNGTILPATINDAQHTSTQPSIAYDQANGKEYLYYVSDREGGEGGLDIWVSEISNGEYTSPTNFSEVNTSYDELTPFYHSNSNTLYFSSDGYLGMGGYDIYSYILNDDADQVPANLKAPTNTSFNDVYYSLNDDGTKAYFSSNRTGSLYLEEGYEACCYDIYRADIEEIFVDLDALVFDGLSEDELLDSRIRIYDAVTNELLFDNIEQLSHEHKFKLKCNKQYTIITEKAGFESDTTSLVTKDCNEPITKKIYLSPIEGKLDVLTFLSPQQIALKGSTVTLYDLSNPDNPPIIISQPDGNLFQYDIIGGREYRIVAERDGYESKELIFTAIDFEDGTITKKIYFDKTFINLNEYLPVVVYFDNDRPDQRSRKLYSDNSYTDTYYPYIAKKEEFKSEFSKNLNGDSKFTAENNVENFFEVDVRGGFSRMRLFIDKLAERLEAGEIIELSLKGFASPRAANKYNLALGQRRIWTLKNEIQQYAGGKLLPYINQGKLQVIEISYGEETSSKSISDSYNNRRLSVYSVEASKQRKAEIVRVRVLN